MCVVCCYRALLGVVVVGGLDWCACVVRVTVRGREGAKSRRGRGVLRRRGRAQRVTEETERGKRKEGILDEGSCAQLEGAAGGALAAVGSESRHTDSRFRPPKRGEHNGVRE